MMDKHKVVPGSLVKVTRSWVKRVPEVDVGILVDHELFFESGDQEGPYGIKRKIVLLLFGGILKEYFLFTEDELEVVG